MTYKYFLLWFCLCIGHKESIANFYIREYTNNELSIEINEDLVRCFQSEQLKVQRFLGMTSFKIMVEAEQINCYLLDPFRHDGETFGGYSIRKKGYAISTINCLELKKILSTDANYAFDNMMKNCTFTPKLGLEFKKGTQILRLLVSYDCRVWRFVGEGINKEEDFDPSYELMMSYLQKIFPNDIPARKNY